MWLYFCLQNVPYIEHFHYICIVNDIRYGIKNEIQSNNVE